MSHCLVVYVTVGHDGVDSSVIAEARTAIICCGVISPTIDTLQTASAPFATMSFTAFLAFKGISTILAKVARVIAVETSL